MPQRDHRIDTHGTPRGYVASEERDKGEDDNRANVSNCVERRDSNYEITN